MELSRRSGFHPSHERPRPFRAIDLARLIDYLGSVHPISSEPATVQLEEKALGQDVDGDLTHVPTPPGLPTKRKRIVDVILLALLFLCPCLISLRGSCADDLDIWWHLRTGEWMLQHHAVPHVDAFSGPAAGQPWLAYSWLFELIVTKLFFWKGLVGLAVYTSAMILAITVALYRMVRRLQADTAVAVAVTFLAMFSMTRLFTPRPWLFTLLFFVLELDILLRVRRTGSPRALAWLPLIFALWANVHIELVDGLLVLGFALGDAVLTRNWPMPQPRVRPVWLGAALVASGLATLVNPYGWRIYAVAHDLATQAGALNKVSELQSLPFRGITDFLILLLAMGSAAALARSGRYVSFETGLLVFAAILSFRSQRDIWVIAIVAAAILASSITRRKPAEGTPWKTDAWMAACVAALLLVASFHLMRLSNDKLENQLAQSLPIRAVEVVRERGYQGPLFNTFDWGGYLIWKLRMPVSLDGRQNLYGDPRMDRSVATWSGAPDWASDPELKSAGLVIGPTSAPLTQLLKTNSHFQLAYEDKLATIFVAKK